MSDENEEFPDHELIPPTAERVVRRAIVMSAIVHRAFMEPYANEPGAEAQCQEAFAWLERLNILDELEGKEKEILRTPLGQLSSRASIDSTWRVEGLAVLAWALSRFELPSYDEQADPKAIADSLYFLSDEAEKLLVSPKLRPQNELEQYAERIFALHWRLRQFFLSPGKMDFKKFSEEAWFGPLDISELRLIDNDLATGQTEISHSSKENFSWCLSIASERHRAVNWLIGYDEIYSEVDTST